LEELSAVDVRIPETIAYGGQWSGLFEKKSFIITLEIPNSHSLETALPDCFESAASNLAKRDFILKLADFIRRFHNTGYRHRDLYLCHIFVSNNETLYLIDLHRTFKPKFLGRRYQVKDLAHLPCGSGPFLSGLHSKEKAVLFGQSAYSKDSFQSPADCSPRPETGPRSAL
ncbi:MAG: lipopolysaccharide kinase InaA family protein, partial [Planctomycetota bacterium]